MQSLGKITIPKDTIGYLSESGFYDYWYPSQDKEIVVPMNTVAEHLALWRHQGTFYAFKVPMVVFHPEEILEYRDQYVCVWFQKADIDAILNSKT